MNTPPATATSTGPCAPAWNSASTTSAFLNRLSFSAPRNWVMNSGRNRRDRSSGAIIPRAADGKLLRFHRLPPPGGARHAALRIRDVVARQRHHGLLVRELDLEHHVVLAPEGNLGARQVELEHPAEPLVVQRADRVAV